MSGRPTVMLRSGQRHHGHRGASIVSAARSSGSRLCTLVLPHARAIIWHSMRQRVEEIVDALSRIVGIEPLAQHRILRGDADRATTGMAVITIAGRNADRALEIGFRNILVAIERDQAAVPIATASAPSASAFATSAPLRMPPA